MCGNGCGPFWWPKIWKDGYFEEACNHHDSLYNQKIGRKQADEIFLDDMLEIIEARKERDDRKLRLIQAYTFYWSVRLLGWHTYYL